MLDKKKNYVKVSIEKEEIYDNEGNVEYGDEYNSIDMVYVEKKNRGKGLGRKLLEDAIENIDNDMPIKLSAQGIEQGTNLNKLVDFYRSVGFDLDETPEGMSGVLMSMPDKTFLKKAYRL